MSNQELKPYVTISLTDACNLRCIYCPPAGENYQTPRTTFAPEGVRQVLQVVADLNLQKVRFTGGEPLLYPQLRQVCEAAASLGLEVHFNTNGLLLTKDLAWLREIPRLFIKVSLDAHTNEAMRRVAGVGQIEPVLAGLRQGSAWGLVQRINFVLTQVNFFHLPGLPGLSLPGGTVLPDGHSLSHGRSLPAGHPFTPFGPGPGSFNRSDSGCYPPLPGILLCQPVWPQICRLLPEPAGRTG